MYAFPLPAENKKSILIDTINNTASFFIITDLKLKFQILFIESEPIGDTPRIIEGLHLALVMLR